MRARLLIAICVLPLEPLAAQRIPDDRSAPRSSRAHGPLADGVVAGAVKGVRIDRYAYVSEVGRTDVRQGVVGSLPIADNASVGVGLYRVTRYSRGEPSFRSLRPMEDVDGRHQRIAAVGMSLRF